ncbi:MAG TPA: hypothetical protein VG291_04920 [Xanthobacteraceae bacterium]|jgi:hypothetical protein|nr:hypothetical protein [Xanthobacteraceae bacterium]
MAHAVGNVGRPGNDQAAHRLLILFEFFFLSFFVLFFQLIV